YAYGMFKGEAEPYPVTENEQFNPLQKLSYVGVIYLLLPVSMITGIALLYPELIVHKVWGLNGTMLTALLHMLMGFLLTLFLLIHLYFASLSKKKFANFKSMITGWHEH
ncbi:MAG: cytochrome b/b6 domain-containing protein, partial [Bacteroidales bacterium]|nr:cytochrome b/b6 domain-containing protein [Bacteroidales bacterium]